MSSDIVQKTIPVIGVPSEPPKPAEAKGPPKQPKPQKPPNPKQKKNAKTLTPEQLMKLGKNAARKAERVKQFQEMHHTMSKFTAEERAACDAFIAERTAGPEHEKLNNYAKKMKLFELRRQFLIKNYKTKLTEWGAPKMDREAIVAARKQRKLQKKLAAQKNFASKPPTERSRNFAKKQKNQPNTSANSMSSEYFGYSEYDANPPSAPFFFQAPPPIPPTGPPAGPPMMASSVPGYQYLHDDWLGSTWEADNCPSTSYNAQSSSSFFPQAPSSSQVFPSEISHQQNPHNQYTPMMPDLIREASQVLHKISEMPTATGAYSSDYGGQLAQTNHYQQEQPQQPSEYHKMFHSSSTSAPAQAPPTSEIPTNFDEAVAMQQRLLQIDKELQDIERQKAEIAMADELRRREEELRLKEEMLQRKEWEFKMREEQMRKEKSSRSKERSREKDSHRHESHRRGRPDHHRHHQESALHRSHIAPADPYDDRPATYKPSSHQHYSSSSASNADRRQINIEMRDRLREERDAEAARRHGQRRPRREEQLQAGGGRERQDSFGPSGSSYRSGAYSRQMNIEAEDISDNDGW